MHSGMVMDINIYNIIYSFVFWYIPTLRMHLLQDIQTQTCGEFFMARIRFSFSMYGMFNQLYIYTIEYTCLFFINHAGLFAFYQRPGSLHNCCIQTALAMQGVRLDGECGLKLVTENPDVIGIVFRKISL